MLLEIENLSKSYGGQEIFQNACLTVQENSRIGLIGINGTGKSTLLHLLVGEDLPDTGRIIRRDNLQIGYLKQDCGLDSDLSIYEELKSVFSQQLALQSRLNALSHKMAKLAPESGEYAALSEEYAQAQTYFESIGGYEMDVKIQTILNGMGFGLRDKNTRVSVLSGGEKTRLSIARLLLLEPDLLILDEPTNHLDFKTLTWLEDYLSTYKNAFIIVSHDRYFLNRLATSIWEIDRGEIYTYKGNYSAYTLQKEQRREREQKEYEQKAQLAQRLQEYVDKNIVRATTAQMAKSRQKQLERLGEIKRPPKEMRACRLHFDCTGRPYKDLLDVQDVSLWVDTPQGQKELASHLDLEVKRGQKIAIIGENGIGKTTFLKAIQQLIPYRGRIHWGENAKWGYFEQQTRSLNRANTVLDELWNQNRSLPEQEIRRLLGNVLFTGEDVYKRVGDLSGGERARLVFALLMRQKYNVLILDEPTNHLDIPSKEALDKALMEFEGTVIMVSHDRYLLSRIPTHIVQMSDKGFAVFEGAYEAFAQHEREQQLKERETAQARAAAPKEEKANVSWRSRAQRSEEVRQKKRLQELEDLIAKQEEDITHLQEQMADPAVAADYQQMQKICQELEEAKNALQNDYDEWEALTLLLEGQ